MSFHGEVNERSKYLSRQLLQDFPSLKDPSVCKLNHSKVVDSNRAFKKTAPAIIHIPLGPEFARFILYNVHIFI